MTNARGFTLVEVMVAAAIILVAVLAIAAAFPNAYSDVDRSGERTMAVSLAQQQIEWARNQSYAALVAGTTAELLTGDYAGYARATQIQGDTPMVGIKQVTVAVATPGGSLVQLRSLIANP